MPAREEAATMRPVLLMKSRREAGESEGWFICIEFIDAHGACQLQVGAISSAHPSLLRFVAAGGRARPGGGRGRRPAEKTPDNLGDVQKDQASGEVVRSSPPGRMPRSTAGEAACRYG